MKYTYLAILIFTLFSCNNEKKEETINKTGIFYPEVESRTVIIGQIENIQKFSNESRTIRLYVNDIPINEQKLYLTEIDDNGKFLFDIPLRNSINTHLNYCDGNIYPYIFPNDTLVMNCKISKVGSLIDLNASSYDENHNKFQKEFQKYDGWIKSEIVKFDKSFSKEKEKPYEEQKEICLNFERSLHETINTQIKNKLSNEIIYDYLRHSATYYSYYRIFRVGKVIKNQEQKELFFSFLTDTIAFNEEALTTSWYRFFLNYYNHYFEPKISIKVLPTGKSDQQVKKEFVTKRIENISGLRKDIWSDFLIASKINSSVVKKEEELSAPSMDYYIQLVKEKIIDKYTQQLLISMLNKERLSILERDKVELPTDSKIENESALTSGDSLHNKILNENKGKVIYIDFWGTWCSSCIKQFPYVENLHKKYSEKDVSFIYLCCKSKKYASENVIKKHQLKGQHYLLSREQFEYFEKRFQIVGFPRYILIDKAGKVYSKNASRPNSDQIFIEIDKLLEEE